MRLVVGLGGNALLRRGERPEIDLQHLRLRVVAAALAGLVEHHELLLTHGNGPQVGLLALQAESYQGGPVVPLDVLGAESEGMIGYLIEQELRVALPGRDLATLLTQVEVDADDPAFGHPVKPIGPVYDTAEGERMARLRGWQMAPEANGLRRVVPSPAPRRIPVLKAIRTLLDAGFVVICGGGGGIPVTAGASGALQGVEAVVDKDRTAALLAEGVVADALVLLTDTPGVYADFGTARQRLIPAASPEELRALRFDAGSMGAKVEAACQFVERTRGWAAIGALEDAARIVAGSAGTRVRVDPALPA